MMINNLFKKKMKMSKPNSTYFLFIKKKIKV